MKAKRIASFLPLCAGLFFCASTASAAVIAEDSFDLYSPGGSVIGQDGGMGWAGPWVAGSGNTGNIVDTSTNPLSFTPAGGSPIQGGARAVELFGTANVPVASRPLAEPQTGTFYAACLMRVSGGVWTDTDTFGIHLSDTPLNTSTLNFGVRGPDLIMTRTGTGAPVGGASMTGTTEVGETSYLVARLSKLDGSGNPTATYDRLELWLNPGVNELDTAPNGHARVQLAAGSGHSTIHYVFARVAALEAGDMIQFDQLILGSDWSDVINPVGAPGITGIVPADGTLFWPASSGFRFETGSTEPILAENITLLLNDVDESARLAVSGDPEGRTVVFDPLESNTLYTAHIVVSNSTGVSQSTVRFDTFSESAVVVIEAEDYNYDDVLGDCDRDFGPFLSEVGGGFQDNPPPSGFDLTTGQQVGGWQFSPPQGYVDLAGVPGVDFNDTFNAGMNPEGNVYRFCDPVGTRVGFDARREKYLSSNLPEYDVFQIQTGEWLNYTRTFAPSHYRVYLRVASVAPQTVQLDRVTSDRDQPNQTTVFQGVFLVPNTGGLDKYAYVPLTDSLGENPVTASLGGVSTLRLTALGANNNMAWNYLVLAPAGESLAPPTVTILSPEEGAEFPSGASVPITVLAEDSDGTVDNVTIMAVRPGSTTVIATLNAPPYDFTWMNPPNGRHILTARATDNHGLTTVSAPVTIQIGEPPREGLFVVGAIPLNAGDTAVQDRLAALGIPVEIVADSASATTDADDKGIVIISSTVLSGNVNIKFRDVALPVIQWESALADDFLFSASGQNLANQDSIVITEQGAAHPLAAGLSAGTHVVRNSPIVFHTASSSQLAPGAVVVATSLSGIPLLLGFEAGAELNNGSETPARRVHLFLGDEGLDGVNEIGLALFDASVHWALGTGEVAPLLSISRMDEAITISWPMAPAGFVLQENPDVGNPAGWADSTRAVEEEGEQRVVTLAAPEGALYFRLRK